MTFYSVSNPYPQILSLTGTGLNDGDVYFGVAGQDPLTHPKTVYWDLAGTQVADQPIPTTGGYLYRSNSPANVYLDSTYSIKVLDKNGAQVYYQANVNDPVFAAIAKIDALASSAGAGEVGYSFTDTYTAGTLGKHEQGFISVTDAPFSAKCDGTTNDTVADQSAVANVSAQGAGKLHVPGPSALGSTVNINRTVDGTSGEFIVEGDGLKGGFTASTAITMFSSSTAVTTAPVSERIRFKDQRFYSTNASAYVISNAFLRTKFDQCYFGGIRFATSAIYLQQIELNDCYAKYWSGTFCTATNGGGTARGLAFRVRGSVFEAGGTGFALNGITGGGITDGLFEGNTGAALTLSDHAGLLISNNYHEGFTAADYQLGDQSTSSGEGHGSAIIANWLQAGGTGYAAVKLGKTWGGGLGNYSNTILYDTTYCPLGSFVSVGDYAVTRKFTGNGFHEATADGVTLMGVPGAGHAATSYTAHAGGGQANATQLLHPTNIVATVATAHDSVALPATDIVIGEYGMLVWVVNESSNILDVYYAQADVTNFGGGGGRTTPFSMPGNTVRGFIAIGQGKFRMIQPPLQAAITAPVGGGTVDTQARTAIASIITALQALGLTQ